MARVTLLTFAALILVPAAEGLGEPATAGVEQPGTAATVSIAVEGMSCGSCAASITRAVKALDGVREVDVDLAGARAVVVYMVGKVSPQRIAGAIAALGYKTGAPTSEVSK